MRLRQAKKILKKNWGWNRYGSGNTRDAFAKVLSSEVRKRGWRDCFKRMEKYHEPLASAPMSETNEVKE